MVFFIIVIGISSSPEEALFCKQPTIFIISKGEHGVRVNEGLGRGGEEEE